MKSAITSPGMTLLEVILSLALLGGTIAVIGEQANSSFQNARHARNLVQAELLAESVLAKIQLGIIEMEFATDVPIGTAYTANQSDIVLDTHAVADDAGGEPWSYSIDITQVADDYNSFELNLIELAVTVRQNVPDGHRAVVCRLVRWMAVEPESADTQSAPDSVSVLLEVPINELPNSHGLKNASPDAQ